VEIEISCINYVVDRTRKANKNDVQYISIAISDTGTRRPKGSRYYETDHQFKNCNSATDVKPCMLLLDTCAKHSTILI